MEREYIAPSFAMPKLDEKTMKEYRKNIISYLVAMSVAKDMNKKGIISEQDIDKIREVIALKYHISSSSIFFK